MRIARLLGTLLAVCLTPSSLIADEIASRHQRFLEEVDLFISEQERSAFASLGRDYQRDRFIERFWEARDPFTQTPRNELRERFLENTEAARDRFDDITDLRAQMILLFGAESRSFRTSCELLEPLEIWYFEAEPGFRPSFHVLFLRRGTKVARAWSPRLGVTGIRTHLLAGASDQESIVEIANRCSRGSDIVNAMANAVDWEELLDAMPYRVDDDQEWVPSFLDSSTDVPEGADSLPAEVAIDFPGRHQSRTVVQWLLSVDQRQARVATLGDHASYNFLVDGEILRDGEFFESFRYKFDLPPAPPAPEEEVVEEHDTGQLPLVLQRYLRPGTYTWILRLQDLNSDRFFRDQADVEVPNLRIADVTPAAPPPRSTEPPRFLREANAVLQSGPQGDHGIKLRIPTDELITGKVRVEAQVYGDGVARVAFGLNGKQLLSKGRPPYSVELGVGRAPRIHRVHAVALDVDGNELARDEVLLNAGPHRFSVRLIEPQSGAAYAESVRAHAEVEIPAGEVLDRVEFFLNEEKLATLYQPPFIQPILIPQRTDLGYVRAVAYLDDGASTEDLVFVNTPNAMEELRINFVELYTSVLDGKGRPTEGLVREDFVVKEGGEEQAIRRFDLVRERPIHAGILLDTSTSMQNDLEEAEKAALRFFDSVLRERDRACLITFNDDAELVVPFTNQVGVLAGGLAGLVAEGETALHDSLVFTLHYFSGLRGKRALVVISDGEDVSSHYSFDEVLEYARRSGVAIYTIGLALRNDDIMPRSKLSRLATETGGRAFSIVTADELHSVYEKIQNELRSQYLLAYQSSHPTGDDDTYREVEVEVKKPGLEAKTMRGYYP